MKVENHPRAIVGSSGFIGGHLIQRYKGSKGYGRHNITDLSNEGSCFSTAIISAAPGAKWIANQNPKEDLDNINTLIKSIEPLKNAKCVLISTIDVFPVNTTFDELTPLPSSHEEAYGRNRGILESKMLEIFNDLHILRLPGMFGPGLKKNVIFDLKNNRALPSLNENSEFQFFDVRDLPSIIELMITQGIKCLNLATEPFSVASLFEEVFGVDAPIQSQYPPKKYLMKSLYTQDISGRQGVYHKSKLEVKSAIKAWVESER